MDLARHTLTNLQVSALLAAESLADLKEDAQNLMSPGVAVQEFVKELWCVELLNYANAAWLLPSYERSLAGSGGDCKGSMPTWRNPQSAIENSMPGNKPSQD